MDGRATVTIDTSSTTMNCATHASARTTPSGESGLGAMIRLTSGPPEG